MKRREALAAVGVGALTATSGCLGHSTDDRGQLEVERPGQAAGDECVEQELLDYERVHFPPGYFRLLGFENAVQWEVEMKEGEELYLRITNPDMMYTPLLAVTDPDGNVLLDSDDATRNIHRINPDRDGTYTLWIGDRRSEGGEWFVDLAWYNAVGCSDPYSEQLERNIS